ncbi:unnamed protein product [Linum tenue]|uniref:Uncharacterized protein n=1 Tax=Linum tenue TaxID=586396 RepID=A0AAV0IDX6_9ROSI|nr:unnamed protein product [Linum tenue]CAI0394768.1 unnamed protein product [Linum tenue]
MDALRQSFTEMSRPAVFTWTITWSQGCLTSG